jgi:DNA ligase 4
MSSTFKFAWLVELLQDLDSARIQGIILAAKNVDRPTQIVRRWFDRYDSKIIRYGDSATSFLSCLFPERLPQRSYALKEIRLAAIFGRALGLGCTRAKMLNSWTDTGTKEFACCVEEVMAECESDPPSPAREVSLEEINAALVQLAANSPFSSAEIRKYSNQKDTHDILAPILRRLRSYEAKWLTRMIVKSYSPVEIPMFTAMKCFHFLLTDVLAAQNTIEAAVDFLSQPEVMILPQKPDESLIQALRESATQSLVPRVGTAMSRQPYDKARSIKHCTSMANRRIMSVERKYDGEYCQVHIDKSRGRHCVQIFSKSGKNSTADRSRLHGAILDSLLIQRPGCRIQSRCILEGELLVWNRTKAEIEPFHKIRRHVMHGGRFLGTEKDSQAAADEQLMIMFYDILLLDDRVLAKESHRVRRQILKGLVKCIPGQAGICHRELIDFASSRAPTQLRNLFAKSICSGWEGLVLKGHEDSYISFHLRPRAIKLKKDYIAGLGDMADLCIVGARRDSKLAHQNGLENLCWTTFYVACLENKAEVVRFGGKPRFAMIDAIGPSSIAKADLLDLNKYGNFVQRRFDNEPREMYLSWKYHKGSLPTTLFHPPIVVEIMGAGFDKNATCDFYTLRFPRLTKIHLDRSCDKTMTFTELQEMAASSLCKAKGTDCENDARWIERLTQADGNPQTLAHKSQSTSPGKTTRSPSTADLSPTSARSSATNIFIRADPSEHCPAEQGQDESSLGFHTRKRKASYLENSPTPISANMRKRPTQSKSQDAHGNSSPSQGSSRSSFPRQPLVEMVNLSPVLPRHTVCHHSAGRLTEATPSSQEVVQIKESTGKSSLRNRETVLPSSNIARQELPTTPRALTKSVAVETLGSKRSRVGKGHNESIKDPASPNRSLSLYDLIRMQSLVLLARSVAVHEKSSQPMFPLLQNDEMHFTCSFDHFIYNALQKRKKKSIILVNSAAPSRVGKEILELGKAITESVWFPTLTTRMDMIFLDLSMLANASMQVVENWQSTDWKTTFCCGLTMSPDVVDFTGQRCVQAFWDVEG